MAYKIDAAVDGSVRWCLEKGQLRDPKAQCVLYLMLAPRQGTGEFFVERRVDLAAPPQHRRDQQTGKRAVARRQFGQSGSLCERRVERNAAIKYRAQKVEGNRAGIEWQAAVPVTDPGRRRK